MEAKEYITLSLAVTGTVLGLVNTFNQLNSKRVRLRVRPKSAILGVGSGVALASVNRHLNNANALCIEVINLSEFPVTISEVGLLVPKGNRAPLFQPFTGDSKPWPRRLESRESVSVYAELSKLPDNMTKAYADTDCGERRVGTSNAMKQLRKLQT